jgi:hypothetical protein
MASKTSRKEWIRGLPGGPLGRASTIANGSTGHRRGRLDMSFSYEIAYETFLTLTFTKQALGSTPTLLDDDGHLFYRLTNLQNFMSTTR